MPVLRYLMRAAWRVFALRDLTRLLFEVDRLEFVILLHRKNLEVLVNVDPGKVHTVGRF